MPIILFGGQKGGTGKSTIATNIAVEHVKRGGDTILVDTDLQGSCALWRDIRNGENIDPQINIVQLRGDSVAKSLLGLQEKYQTIIVDAGGQDSKELRQAMGVADYLYTPIQASQFDVATIDRMRELVNAVHDLGSTVQPYIIINRLSPNPNVTELQQALEALQDYTDVFNIAKDQNGKHAVIRDRIAFRKANSEGMAVSELPQKDFSAIREMRNLYSCVFERGQENDHKVA